MFFHPSARPSITSASIDGFPRKRGVVTTRPVFFFLGVFTLCGWIFFFFFGDWFMINEIQLRGTKELDAYEVRREVLTVLDGRPFWRPWPARHTWFVDPSHLAKNLKERLFVENVVVDKMPFNILRLIIEEHANRVIYHSHKQYVWVDMQGVVKGMLTDQERKIVQARLLGQTHDVPRLDDPPIIHKDLDEPITVGYAIADPQTVKTWIRETVELVKARIAYREYNIEQDGQKTFTSEDGYVVRIDTSMSLEAQLKSYNAFKSSRSNAQVSDYVDVRIPGKIFYK